MLSFEVDSFFMNGNVMVNNLSLTEEHAALKRLKSFLVDFGDLVNFSLQRWFQVIVVIQSNESALHIRGSASPPKLVSHFEYHSERNFHIVKVPHDFKRRAFLDFLRVKLPVSRHISYDISYDFGREI